VVSRSTTAQWQDLEFSFTVPAADCPAQYVKLVFDVRSASEKFISGNIWFDDFKIAREEPMVATQPTAMPAAGTPPPAGASGSTAIPEPQPATAEPTATAEPNVAPATPPNTAQPTVPSGTTAAPEPPSQTPEAPTTTAEPNIAPPPETAQPALPPGTTGAPVPSPETSEAPPATAAPDGTPAAPPEAAQSPSSPQ
jgi:hypothetical protein